MQIQEDNKISVAEQTEEIRKDRPSRNQIEAELLREKYKHSFSRNIRNTVFVLIVVSAIAILIATLWLPVFRIYGSSMEPTLTKGEVVVALKTDDFKTGEMIAFYYNNKILVKRVIATAGDWVDIDENGNVFVNDVYIEEDYLPEKALGDCNIRLPYQVPESKVFVMGDNRSTSVDSRNSALGCVGEEQIVGKIIFRVWPFEKIEKLQ